MEDFSKGGFMKAFVLFALTFATYAASAVEISVGCQTKAWRCIPNMGCQWVDTSTVRESRMILRRDPRFPNDRYPYEVWRGQYRDQYDNHFLTIDITYTDQDTRNPLTLFARLDSGGVSAETSGLDRIDIGLHNATYGRGFFCPSIFPVP